MRSLDGGGPIPPPPSLSLPSRSEKGASLGAASCAATTPARREAKRLASNVETSRTGGTMWQLALLVGLGRDAISALAPIAGSSAVRVAEVRASSRLARFRSGLRRQRNGSGGGYVRFPFPPQPSTQRDACVDARKTAPVRMPLAEPHEPVLERARLL